MLKTILVALLSFNIFLGNGSGLLVTESTQTVPKGNSGTLEKMIVANGSVAMNLDLNRLNGSRSRGLGSSVLRFEVERDSFFTVIVLNNEFRGPTPSSMELIPQGSANIPSKLGASYKQLVVESTEYGNPFELIVRDGKTGFIFFNIEGQSYDFNSDQDVLDVRMGRMLLSKEFAVALGRRFEIADLGN